MSRSADRAGLQFVGGHWIASTGTGTVAVENPATTEVLTRVCRGTPDDVDAAVAAAAAAAPMWAATALDERIAVVRRAAALLEERAEEIARTVTAEVGTPLEVSRAVQVGRPIQVLRALVDAAPLVRWIEQIDAALVVRGPLGVVAAVTPWNVPLHQSVAKIGAALLAGCTVVHKPSEVAPSSAYALADALAEAGLPAGAHNVITGLGETVGEALACHPGIDGISFTGSTAVGRRIGAVAAQNITRVALELGGKGPSIVLRGADVAAAAVATAARCFTNSGQICAALSRLIVPREELAVAEQALSAHVGRQRLGDPLDPATTLGPLVSGAQRARVRTLIEAAVGDGARVVAGGPDAIVPETGYFVAPTVLSDVHPAMPIARTEVFGPVLCVLPYETEDEAVEIADDSEYGLVGAVFGADDEHAAMVASRLRLGMVGVNGGRLDVRAPFGGHRRSGIGREFGVHGIEEFLETTTMNFAAADRIVRPAV
ncbi:MULTISPECIES: aldehyde dehydrogenase family protein [Pseudonocardia]|uniref:aldehyde dehydrogenase (NAD(+)) n=1 Tax=Pseudonocardia saturnea TaxID=33909 RepID=A0ABQ0RVD9_9PSEU|nr:MULTISPECIES: aldehyde dehydrogenase family protein [Pseudonocardia]TDN71893.1 aldehyde dehydrogenase (NAD+) [Pseudonocardia autotrophica]BBG02581.1 aldehyde dehydrogenase [Pseudonocardia autotrophica]GEC24640.1 aldehyde dehydrogenase [Pseudonocardia saturnea]